MAGSEEVPPVVSEQVPDLAGNKAVALAAAEGKDANDAVGVITADSIEFGATALPKGTVDAVYERKARVLNHAVRI